MAILPVSFSFKGRHHQHLLLLSRLEQRGHVTHQILLDPVRGKEVNITEEYVRGVHVLLGHVPQVVDRVVDALLVAIMQ